MLYEKTPLVMNSGTHTKIKYIAVCQNKKLFEVCEDIVSFYISKHPHLKKLFKTLNKPEDKQ